MSEIGGPVWRGKPLGRWKDRVKEFVKAVAILLGERISKFKTYCSEI